MALEMGMTSFPSKEGSSGQWPGDPICTPFLSRTLRISSSRNAADLFKLVGVNPVLHSSA
jgi:hypothetical protein